MARAPWPGSALWPGRAPWHTCIFNDFLAATAADCAVLDTRKILCYAEHGTQCVACFRWTKGKTVFVMPNRRSAVLSSPTGERLAALLAGPAPVLLPKNSMAPMAEGKGRGQGRSRTAGVPEYAILVSSARRDAHRMRVCVRFGHRWACCSLFTEDSPGERKHSPRCVDAAAMGRRPAGKKSLCRAPTAPFPRPRSEAGDKAVVSAMHSAGGPPAHGRRGRNAQPAAFRHVS